MKAWARCPECSPFYPPWEYETVGAQPRDKVVEIGPGQTYCRIEGDCPDCGEPVRLSVGGPVIREHIVSSESDSEDREGSRGRSDDTPRGQLRGNPLRGPREPSRASARSEHGLAERGARSGAGRSGGRFR